MRALVGLAVAVACAVAAVPVAEASFPGRNGLLAFSRFSADLRVIQGMPDITIWLVNPRSGRARPLTRVPRRCAGGESTWEDSDPSFSASGRLVVYAHTDTCDRNVPDGIYVIRPDGRGRRLISTGADSGGFGILFPAISPSGRLVAFDNGDGSTFITRVARPHRQRELELARSDYESAYPTWGVTGRLALTVGQGPLRGHIATVRPDGSDLRLVTRSIRDLAPDWSPTADRIVFGREKENPPTASDPERGDILVSPARSRRHRRPKRLTHTRDASSPAWSPDGRYIAFVRERPSGDASLTIMRARDGRGQRSVADGVNPVSRISWQPRPRR